jgi:hypothetical protein
VEAGSIERIITRKADKEVLSRALQLVRQERYQNWVQDVIQILLSAIDADCLDEIFLVLENPEAKPEHSWFNALYAKLRAKKRDSLPQPKDKRH